MRELSSRLAHSNLHPKNQNGTYLRKQRVKHAGKTEKIRNPPINENKGPDKKRIRIESKAFIAYSELALDEDSGTPYRLIQNEPTPAPTKPTFSKKDQDNGNTLTQITEDLVALHIGYNPKLTSATMLVDSGASHILVRQEHIHLKMSSCRHPTPNPLLA